MFDRLICGFLGLSLLFAGGVEAQDISRSVKITRQGLGSEWPFTVSEGTLGCIKYGSVTAVTFSTGNKKYGVNGIAQSRLKLPAPQPIWKDNPAIPGTKIPIGTVLDKGLQLCR